MSGTTSDHLPLAMAAVAVGSMVQGVLGFACSLVWMSIFPLFTSVRDAVGVLQPLAISLNILILSRTYRHATLRELRPLALTAPVGIAFGLWVVTSWSARAVNGLLGSFLLLYTCQGCGKRKEEEVIVGEAQVNKEVGDESELECLHNVEAENTLEELPQSPLLSLRRSPTSIAAGFVGGCLTSAFGTGGPAILVYAHEAGWEDKPDKFRANLQVIFFAMNVLAVSSQVAGGIITAATVRSSAMLVPALVAGGIVGSKLAPRVPKDAFRTLVLNGLRIMGVLFVSKALR